MKKKIALAMAAVGLVATANAFFWKRRDQIFDLFAQNTPEPDPTIGQPVSSASVFFIGHSLVGPVMPELLAAFATARNKTFTTHGQLGWGTELAAHWTWNGVVDAQAPRGFATDNPIPFFAGEAKAQLDTGAYDVLILTESAGHVVGSTRRTVDHATLFVERARARAPRMRVYVYSGWPDFALFRSVADWRAQIREDRRWWERVVDGINRRVVGPDVALIPAGALMADVSEAVDAGRIPGIARTQDLFRDTVHPNNLGFYTVALIVYAAVFREAPLGLPSQALISGGQVTVVESAAKALQPLVWERLRQDSRTAMVRGDATSANTK